MVDSMSQFLKEYFPLYLLLCFPAGSSQSRDG